MFLCHFAAALKLALVFNRVMDEGTHSAKTVRQRHHNLGVQAQKMLLAACCLNQNVSWEHYYVGMSTKNRPHQRTALPGSHTAADPAV